jgi:hypothetical protein
MACWKDRKWIGKIQSFELKAKAARGRLFRLKLVSWIGRKSAILVRASVSGLRIYSQHGRGATNDSEGKKGDEQELFHGNILKKGDEPKGQQFGVLQAAVVPG